MKVPVKAMRAAGRSKDTESAVNQEKVTVGKRRVAMECSMKPVRIPCVVKTVNNEA